MLAAYPKKDKTMGDLNLGQTIKSKLKVVSMQLRMIFFKYEAMSAQLYAIVSMSSIFFLNLHSTYIFYCR